MNSATFAARLPSDPGLVNLDVLGAMASDSVLVRAHHTSAKLVENLERSLVPREPKLPLTMVAQGVRRLQLNGFSDFVLPELLCAKGAPDVEFILQCSTLEAVARAEEFRKIYPNVSALWDKSGGAGVPMDSWPLPLGDLRIGYAGGISEGNVTELLTKLTSNREPRDFWIDLESGARTSDEFDLAKVRRVLELARPFI
jgi:phosphoribosylanthranilate isomerase